MTTAIAFKLDGNAEAGFPALPPPAETAHVIATDAEAIDVAKQVAAEFHAGAAARDRDKRLPIAEIDRYSQSGLWSLNVPNAFGGPELSYATIARAIAIIAAADPSLAQVTQNHIDFVDTVRTTGSDAQKKYFFDLVLRGYRTGNAFSEFGSRTAAAFQTRIASRGDDFTVSGRKFYCSGALLAHLVPITALDDSGKSYIAVADRRAGGLTIVDDWSSFGQRTTASGTAIIDNLIVPSSHVLRTYTAEDAPSVNGAICQIIHAAVDQGIAQGAIDETLAFVRGSSRPWIDSGKDYAHEDPYTISAVGDLFIRLHAAEALLERAGRFVDIAVTEPSLTNVAAASIAVAEAKVLTTETAILATNKLFELAGTRSTLEKHQLDRHWRNARVHTLHDPVRWKYAAVGNFYLSGVNPPRHSWI